jgi:hypothetical protein
MLEANIFSDFDAGADEETPEEQRAGREVRQKQGEAIIAQHQGQKPFVVIGDETFPCDPADLVDDETAVGPTVGEARVIWKKAA